MVIWKSVLCGMKTKQMKTKERRNSPVLALTALALLGLTTFGYGQGEPLCDLATGTTLLEMKELPRVMLNASPKRVPVKITDDGRQGDERAVTAQLIFAFASERVRSVIVDVFDEQGHKVRQQTLTSRPGRSALAMDVEGLREGRYVARLREGESAKMVRFQR